MATTRLSALRSVPARALLGALRAYRLLLSPWLGTQCRFAPTCSLYAIDALERHGAAAGSYLAVRRVLRCHPWCEGGIDTVPEQAPRPFARPWRRAADAMSPRAATLAGSVDSTSSKIAP